MSGRLQQQPHNGHYALLALLPPAAGFLAWRASEHLAGLDHTWAALGAGVLAGVAAGAVWARRVRTSVVATLAVGGLLGEVVFRVITRGGEFAAVGLAEAFLVGPLLVGEVVLALWMHGNYRFEVGHRVSVWLLSGRTGADPDHYQALCECTWASDRFDVADGDDSEERAFEAAHGHSPTVRADIAVQY